MDKLQSAQVGAAYFVKGLLEGTDVQVRFGMGPAYDPDNKVIWFPHFTSVVSQTGSDPINRVLSIYKAMAMHEQAHPLHTTGDKPASAVAGFLWNAIEDIRVDSISQRRYAGGQMVLEAGYRLLIEDGYWSPPADDADLVQTFTAWVLHRGRADIAGQFCFANFAKLYDDAMLRHVDPASLAAAWDIVQRTRLAACTADVGLIVDELLAWLKSQLDQQQASGSEGSDSPSQGDDDGAQGQLQGSGTGPHPQPLTQQDLDRIDAACSQLPQDVGSALSDAFAADASGGPANPLELPVCHPASQDRGLYIGDSDARPLAIRLSRLLETQSQASVSYDRRGSRVDTQRLARWRLGERDVFFDEIDARRVDTAVMLLVDRSSSMRTADRITVASTAALRLSLALSDVPGVALSAAAFPEAADSSRSDVRCLLPFGARARSYAGAFHNLDAPWWATTPMASALVYAHYALLRRSEPRRLCIVLTDGEPDGGEPAVKPVLDMMSRDRIQVIGLGIGTMYVSSLFSRHEVINDLADLEPALFKLLQSSLINQRLAA